MNITESSGLIELLVKDDLIEEAVDVTERMLSREAYPMPRIFRFLLNRLASRYKNTKILLLNQFTPNTGSFYSGPENF